MSKEDAILIADAAILILSTLLLIFILYILFAKTPKAMKTYRWLLVNIQVCLDPNNLKGREQISAYATCVYWTIFMTPISETYPVPHIYFIGLMHKWFGMPVKAIFVSFPTNPSRSLIIRSAHP